MPRYRLEEAHYLGDRYFEAGAVVDWSGAPGKHMTPVEEIARQRKDDYDRSRPHIRQSRDLPTRAAMLHDPMARQPGTPRVAGPPGQAPAPSADPANIERTIQIAEDRKEFAEQDAEAREAALTPEPAAEKTAEDDDAATKPKNKAKK